MSIELLYDSVRLQKAVKLRKPPPQFFRGFFAEQAPQIEQYVAIDLKTYGEEASTFRSPRMDEGHTVERSGYRTIVVEPAYVHEQMITTSKDVYEKARRAGEAFAGELSPMQRAEQQLAEDYETLYDRLDRRIEIMAAQALLDGIITISGEGVSRTIDFDRHASLDDAAVSVKWDNANAKPLADITAKAKLIRTHGGGRIADVVVHGDDAADAFIEKMGEKLKRDSGVDLGHLTPGERLPTGVQYLGRADGYEHYRYSGSYKNSSGTVVELMPAKKVLVLASGAERSLYFGMIQSLACPGPTAVFPHSWEPPNKRKRFISLESAPVPVPVENNAAGLITVLT